MTSIHEVNKRIIDEIKDSNVDDKTKEFLLAILDFELEHFDERSVKNKIRFSDEYEKIIDRCCTNLGE